ncbi:hypothetical protein [Clavibacter tessellarius]|uniref:hypothetical protein n=1 Tax=Clavibacter tessellarius TaxID=31965 RepID=UPI00324E5DE8
MRSPSPGSPASGARGRAPHRVLAAALAPALPPLRVAGDPGGPRPRAPHRARLPHRDQGVPLAARERRAHPLRGALGDRIRGARRRPAVVRARARDRRLLPLLPPRRGAAGRARRRPRDRPAGLRRGRPGCTGT